MQTITPTPSRYLSDQVRVRLIFTIATHMQSFPTVGEGGFIVGVALGKGRVYVDRRWVGDAARTLASRMCL